MKSVKALSYAALALAVILIPAVLALGLSLADSVNWSIISTLIMILVMTAFYFRFERHRVNSKDLAVIATMAALAAAGRIPFAAIPSLQPTTFLVIITGYVFGVQPGFMVGATAALVSNFMLGQGPWTPWQMLAWGLAGVSAGILGKVMKVKHTEKGQAGSSGTERRLTAWRFKLSFFALAWGFLFGWLMNIYTWTTFVYPLDWDSFWATQVTSLPMDVIHAAGNFLFTFVLGPQFIRVLMRFRKRMMVERLPERLKWELIRQDEI